MHRPLSLLLPLLLHGCTEPLQVPLPDRGEWCNGVDDDADGLVDDEDPDCSSAGALYLWEDADGDGWGDPTAPTWTCEAGPGLSVDPGDCDDDDAAVHPGAIERCNGKDDDCDNALDEADPDLDPPRWFWDGDGDGWGALGLGYAACVQPEATVTIQGDCDDANPDVNPDAAEVCDGGDDDCDGLVDDDDPDLEAKAWTPFYLDVDGDGFGDPATARSGCAPGDDESLTGGDCDDDDRDVHPGAPEICGDGVDQDCSGDRDDHCTLAGPLPPAADRPEWQGRKTWFVNDQGRPCEGGIVLAVGNEATCLVDAGGALRCAGRVEGLEFGDAFVATGEQDASQVAVSSYGSVCAVLDGVLRCAGSNNAWGVLGLGHVGSTEGFETFGADGDVVGMATGDFGSLCVLGADGAARCAGAGWGPAPVVAATGIASMVYLDTRGALLLDDPDRWSVSQNVGDCFVRAEGLACSGVASPVGTPGAVVMGGRQATPGERVTWLEDDGRVWRRPVPGGTPVELFAGLGVVYLAPDRFSDGVCAVPADGSLWCLGSNAAGRFGTGDRVALASETRVLPTGTFETSCW